MVYFFQFSWTIILKALYIISARKKEKAWAITYLKNLQHQYQAQLDGFTFYKIVDSYAIFTPVICDAFSLLNARKTNRNERIRILHYFICSSIFDNFIDWNLLGEEELYKISFQPETYAAQSISEKLFIGSHLFLKSCVKKTNEYIEVTHKLFDIQQQSAQQFNANISEKVIERITLKKGGFSLLLCSFYFDREASVLEKNCWYALGEIIQLTNDLYDIYKDLQNGSHTLATRMKNIFEFEVYFKNLINQFMQVVQNFAKPSKKKIQFAVSMAGVSAFGLIAINQLKNYKNDENGSVDIKRLNRKDIIVDMEKLPNIIKWLYFVYKYGKQ